MILAAAVAVYTVKSSLCFPMEFFLIELIFPLADTLATLAIACQALSLLVLVLLAGERMKVIRKPNGILNLLAHHSVLLMFVVAFTASMGSLFFSEIAGWPPCKLCWLQRIFMYPQVILIGMALWRRSTDALPSILFLCLVGMSISAVHYAEQMLAILNPIAFDPSVPCDFSGISCKATHLLSYNYITIPMLALTAFVSNALIAASALRLSPSARASLAQPSRWTRFVAAPILAFFLLFLSWTVLHKQNTETLSGETPLLFEDEPSQMTSLPVLVPKDELEIVQAQEGTHWTHAPAVPLPITRSEQKKIVVEWEATERIGDLDPAAGVRYEFWGIEGSVPGPTLRVRQGDLIEIRLTNNIDSNHPHNIDFHFATGPGGGAQALSVKPGETAVVHLRALQPGFFMYHCATPDIPTHIANGMYGGVIVDPADAPLPPVDNEFAIVQSEFYTENDKPGIQELSLDRLDAEDPTYVVFNGFVGALTGENSPYVNVGDRIRLYVLNAGPQLISSFHVIGEIFDRVYREADFLSPPGRNIQSTLIPAGGATVVDFVIDVPGTYILVDHAIARAMHKGAVGTIIAEGADNFEIFQSFADDNAPDGHMNDDAYRVDTEQELPDRDAGSSAENEVIIRILKGSMIRDNDPDNDYAPKVLTVKPGTTVTWINEDRVVHTVTARDRTFNSGNVRKGERWSYTFTEVGEYDYFCLPHPWMTGAVIVKE